MDSYDRWKTTPPDEPESKCKCSYCGENLYEGDYYFKFYDELFCERCADEWIEEQKQIVTEDMERGD